MIEINNLSKTFSLSKQQRKEMGREFKGKTVDAVKDVSFTCQPGRIFTLLGPNGAGKTTTLRLIATILKPTTGTINVAGFNSVTDGVEVRKRLGFLTGGTGLYDRLTPNETIDYFGKLNGMNKEIIQKRKKELFDLLGINEFANRRVGKFSTGMKQKVSIARTMIHDPEIIVFDEPTAGLDVIAAKSIIELIRTCKKQNKTIIFSTHIMSEVNMLSDDLAIMHKGGLIYNGLFSEFKNQMREATLEDEFIRMAGEHELIDA
ncbi:MAG: ATP-binding cassette domain-containing protein [Fimbriimonadaceae bacterium]|nr:ATP-binding cassette domain-containing protein [Chitinophagales bacterium]